MNNSLNEYLRFNFELNIELNHFLARFNVKMNNQNVSATPTPGTSTLEQNAQHFLQCTALYSVTKNPDDGKVQTC